MGEQTGHLSRPPARRPPREALRKRCRGHTRTCCRQSRRHQPRRPDPSRPHTRASRCVHTGRRLEKASSDPLPSPGSPQDKVTSTWSVEARALRDRGWPFSSEHRGATTHSFTPSRHPAGGGHGHGRDRAAPVQAQASLTPSRAIKGKLSHSSQGGHTQRLTGPRREGSWDAWPTSPEPHAAQPPSAGMMQAINKETTGHSEGVFLHRRAKQFRSNQLQAERPDRPAPRTPASPGWPPATPTPRGHPRKAGPRSRPEAFPQPTAVTSAGKEKSPQPTVGLPPGLPSLRLVWLRTRPFSEPEAL